MTAGTNNKVLNAFQGFRPSEINTKNILKDNQFAVLKEPSQILPRIKTITNRITHISEHNMHKLHLTKQELMSYLARRFKSPKLLSKLEDFFFHSQQRDMILIQDYFKRGKTMLSWSRMDQLGFCFNLFDLNSDGFICIEDLFQFLKEMTDFDFVAVDDINKLVHVLRQKALKMRVLDQVSPMIYGIYDQYENTLPADFKPRSPSPVPTKSQYLQKNYDEI